MKASVTHNRRQTINHELRNARHIKTIFSRAWILDMATLDFINESLLCCMSHFVSHAHATDKAFSQNKTKLTKMAKQYKLIFQNWAVLGSTFLKRSHAWLKNYGIMRYKCKNISKITEFWKCIPCDSQRVRKVKTTWVKRAQNSTTTNQSDEHYNVLPVRHTSTIVFYKSMTWALLCFTNQLHEHYRVLPISQMHTTVLCCSTLQSCECYSVQLVIVLYQSDQWTLHCAVTWTLQCTTSQSQEQSNILSISQMSTAMMSSQPAKKHSNVLPDKH